MKPVILDAFCKAGGCTRGYQEVGFEVVGIDIEPQPNYCGDHFIQCDALAFLAALAANPDVEGTPFAAAHASPPCQAFTKYHNTGNVGEYPDLIGPVREPLKATGLPYVIENVEGAPLVDPVRVKDIVDRIRAGDSPAEVAKDFGLRVESVTLLMEVADTGAGQSAGFTATPCRVHSAGEGISHFEPVEEGRSG